MKIEEIKSIEQRQLVEDLQSHREKLNLSYFTFSTGKGCAPLAVSFINHSENAMSYLWNFGDGGTSVEKNPTYVFDEPGTFFINLTIMTMEGQVSIYTDSIHVYPLPEIHFDISTDEITGSGQPVYFYNYTRGAESYEWKFGDGNSSMIKDPSHFYEKPGNYDVTLFAQSIYGCKDSVTIRNAFSEKSPEIVFPTAFTPNMNGPSGGHYNPKDISNDIFYPVSTGVIEDYQLKVYNRSGILVFQSDDIHIGWDGYYNQVLLPQGVYIWKARGRFADGRSFVKAGDVTLFWKKER